MWLCSKMSYSDQFRIPAHGLQAALCMSLASCGALVECESKAEKLSLNAYLLKGTCAKTPDSQNI